MRGVKGEPLKRPDASRALEETRKAGRTTCALLAPGQRMQMAFAISMDALRLCRAGLEMRGFSESEVFAILDEKGR